MTKLEQFIQEFFPDDVVYKTLDEIYIYRGSRIVKLSAKIAEIVAREQVLRNEIDKIIAEIEV